DHRDEEFVDLLGVGDLAQQEHVALVGRGAVERDRAQRRPAGSLEQHGLLEVRRLTATKTLGRLECQQPGLAGQLYQFGAQRIVGTVPGQPRVGLVGHDLVDDECADFVAQRRDAGGYLEIDHADSISVSACSNSRTVASCSRSPTSFGALPALARAFVPSSTMPSLKQASTVYQVTCDRSRVVLRA